jgi:hypothetical protein
MGTETQRAKHNGILATKKGWAKEMKLSMLNRFHDFIKKEVQDKLEAAEEAELEYDAARKENGLLHIPNEIIERRDRTIDELKTAVAALKELDETDFR